MVKMNESEVPEWLPFSAADCAKVEEKIAFAERKTAGEVVVSVAHSSVPWQSLKIGLALVTGFIAMGMVVLSSALIDMIFWNLEAEGVVGEQSAGVSTVVAIAALLHDHHLAARLVLFLLLTALAVGLVFWARRSAWWLRALTSERDRNILVNMRAELEFFESGLDKTQGETGVLIYVSLAERMAVVLADKWIDQKVSKDTWKSVVSNIVFSAREHKLADGLQNAVSEVADVLSQHFPVQGENPNEVSNRLRFLGPLI